MHLTSYIASVTCLIMLTPTKVMKICLVLIIVLVVFSAMDVWLSNTERVLQEKYNSLNFPLLHGIISEASADAAVQIANLQNRLSNSMVTDAKSGNKA